MDTLIQGVELTRLLVIDGNLGSVYHGLKKSEQSFCSFGEAYFSAINFGAIKGWKKHRKMRLNLIVPVGKVRFTVFDDRPASDTNGSYFTCILSTKENYARLTIGPDLWVAFEGMELGLNLVLNIASIEHDPEEVEQTPIDGGVISYPTNV